MHLILAGINHETAPIAFRECLAYSEKECEASLANFQDFPFVEESLLLSTCNRTELYAVWNPDHIDDPGQAAEGMIDFLLKQKNAGELNRDLFYVKKEVEAARHMFRVAAGLESMVRGEAQILAQVKAAYGTGCRVHSCGTVLHKLSHAAFRAGKKARTETDIGVGAVSVSLAAVELAERIFKNLDRKKALVIGAGEMAALTAQHFADKSVADLAVTNRTVEKARELAGRLGGRALPFSRLADAVAGADVVIVSTAAPYYIITPDIVKAAMKLRRNKSVFLMDIAVPRNVDPEVKKIYNVFSHDIDDLKNIVDSNLERRKSEIPRVERIIESELDDFVDWYAERQVTPTIKELMEQVEEIRREEIRRNAKHFNKEQMEQIDILTRSIVKKILHHPITTLKSSKNGREDIPYWVETVRNVFNLGKGSDE